MDSSWLNGNDFQWLRPTQSDGTFLRAMELGMRMKHARMTEALAIREAESKVKLMDTNARLKEAEIIGYEQMAAGNAELAETLSATAGRWTSPEAKAQFWGVAAKYPQVMKSPQFKELVDNFQLADTAELRKQLLENQIAGREDLETMKFQNREKLLDEKYTRLAELQEDSQEARTLRDEILHEYKLEEDAKRPRSSSGVSRFDLPWTDQEAMKAEMDTVKKDLFAKPEDKMKRIETITRKYKTIAEQNAAKRSTGTPTNVPAKVLKFNPDTGKFE